MKSVVIQTDPVADMLSRIRNAMAVGKGEVEMPHSKLKENVAKVLVKYGFLNDVKTDKDGKFKILKVAINPADESSKITKIARLSRPGRRLYASADKIPTVKHGRGIIVVSTSSGVMASTDAKAKGLGGELICEVY
jgi:small subunit ribosomal protein S8